MSKEDVSQFPERPLHGWILIRQNGNEGREHQPLHGMDLSATGAGHKVHGNKQRLTKRIRPKWVVVLSRKGAPERKALGPYRSFTAANGVVRKPPRGWMGEVFRLEEGGK